MNGGRIRRPLAGPSVWVAALGVAAAGCSSGEAEPPTRISAPQTFSADRVCGGLFAGEGGKALERILESTNFRFLDEKANRDLSSIAQTMEDAYRSGKRIRDMPQPVCEVAGPDKERHIPTVRLMFTAYSKHAGDPVDFPGVSDSGVRVSADGKRVYFSYDCVSPRVGSTADIPLRIKILFHEQWDESKGATALAQDYLAVTHSAALAVAEALGCVDDGGLPARAQELPPSAGAGTGAGSAGAESPAP
ncbi:hypothetical protein ACFXAO_06410 [Streptomyces lavendulae]|uniref:hypothetical protein n=1 Tax=Streptomyces lavendulae TaxID=1914 RepID=UPI00367C4AE6